MISRVRDIISKNRVYAWMIIFIILLQACILLTHTELPKPTKDSLPLSREEFKLQLEERQEAMREILLQNYGLAQIMSLIFMFGMAVIITGLVLLSGYIIKKRRGTEPIPRTLETEAPLWGIGDVIRIAIIFIFLSYTFSAFSYILKLHFSGEGLDRRAGLVASTTFMDFLIFMFVLRFVIVKYKQNISALGISAKRLVKNIMVGVYSYVGFLPILTVLFLTVLVIAKLLNYTPPPEPVYELIFEEKRPYLLVIISCLIALLGPIIEEVFFRGFLYTALRKRAGVLFSILISASLFSLLHTNLLGFVPILALGMLLAYVREKTGSLIPSITIHVIHNTALAGMMFFVRELSSKTL